MILNRCASFSTSMPHKKYIPNILKTLRKATLMDGLITLRVR